MCAQTAALSPLNCALNSLMVVLNRWNIACSRSKSLPTSTYTSRTDIKLTAFEDGTSCSSAPHSTTSISSFTPSEQPEVTRVTDKLSLQEMIGSYT
jgi:hypothetical protein